MLTLKSVVSQLDEDVGQFLYKASYNGDSSCIKLVFSIYNRFDELVDITVYLRENRPVDLVIRECAHLDKDILALINKLMEL